ncbi:hypothetical protein [Streptomyces sp. MH13]|uniref:hypothetical protein n=1 Tax=Streptomyces sp. MH13 TaxID=3417651 RepID=UPI003CE883CD
MEGVGAVLPKPLDCSTTRLLDRSTARPLGRSAARLCARRRRRRVRRHQGHCGQPLRAHPRIRVPSAAAQAKPIETCLDCAGAEPGTIGCPEAHGTGTEAGDLIGALGCAGRSRSTPTPRATARPARPGPPAFRAEAAAGISGLLVVPSPGTAPTVRELQHLASYRAGRASSWNSVACPSGQAHRPVHRPRSRRAPAARAARCRRCAGTRGSSDRSRRDRPGRERVGCADVRHRSAERGCGPRPR